VGSSIFAEQVVCALFCCWQSGEVVNTRGGNQQAAVELLEDFRVELGEAIGRMVR